MSTQNHTSHSELTINAETTYEQVLRIFEVVGFRLTAQQLQDLGLCSSRAKKYVTQYKKDFPVGLPTTKNYVVQKTREATEQAKISSQAHVDDVLCSLKSN